MATTFVSEPSYYSADLKCYLPSVNRTSRPLYRFSNREQNMIVDQAMPTPDLNARMTDIRQIEENIRIESFLLMQNNNVPMGRSSTPSPAYCFHCDHRHREKCCLYIGDNEEDINRYSAWKQDLEQSCDKPQHTSRIPDAISGNTTPYWFPQFTYTNPYKKEEPKKKEPSRAKQFYHPLLSYSMSKGPFDYPKTTATPYQQYMMHLRDMNKQFTLDAGDQFDQVKKPERNAKQFHYPLLSYSLPKRPFEYPKTTATPYQQYMMYLREMNAQFPLDTGNQFDQIHHTQPAEPYKGVQFIQQFHTYHVYNGPVYVQHHNQTPFYNDHHHYYQRYQQEQQQQYMYNEQLQSPHALAHNQHLFRYPQSVAPTVQPHSSGHSFPLWMLFYQKKSLNDEVHVPRPAVCPVSSGVTQPLGLYNGFGCTNVPMDVDEQTQHRGYHAPAQMQYFV
ncbi:uncharacterized protein LOC129731875 isoform X1 [Wyeomyia smithii]|uniref:uncharacterized protein LOC129731875 isoform X1 n=1 Tax=Wyeomyia smithii TaxID=174621 RepID=UPI002467C677|nr:uncharacterized protein LOC129731875 isoform X1 [Wyeomyia smithii]